MTSMGFPDTTSIPLGGKWQYQTHKSTSIHTFIYIINKKIYLLIIISIKNKYKHFSILIFFLTISLLFRHFYDNHQLLPISYFFKLSQLSSVIALTYLQLCIFDECKRFWRMSSSATNSSNDNCEGSLLESSQE